MASLANTTFGEFAQNDANFNEFVQEHGSLIESVLLDLNSMEPQPRYRTNTWPPTTLDQSIIALSPPTDILEVPITVEDSEREPVLSENSNDVEMVGPAAPCRNAWGNRSYAELIEQAIRAAPQSRLTLAEIYKWMTTNIDHFRERADANQSCSWKNSVRHNLSLQTRFVRSPRDSPGGHKSSWWMLRADPPSSVRGRRRTSASGEVTVTRKASSVAAAGPSAPRDCADVGPSPNAMDKGGDDYQPQIEATATTSYHSTSFFGSSSLFDRTEANSFGQAVPQASSPISVSTSSSVPTNLHFVLPAGTRVLFPTEQEGVYYEQQTSTSEGDVKVYFRLQPVNTTR